MADIFAEWTSQDESQEPIWQPLADGSSRLIGAGVGLVLITPEDKSIEYALKIQFKATNNEAEYEAVITRLQLCKALEAKRISLKTDSLLVTRFWEKYKAKDANMQKYLQKKK